ncbi:MAG: hypothetical protein C0622_03320 [Desulfuromonas sp.]|nr:MAG: hypothetical protein C0622_03320 [Desulfuromonas sp.]
MKNNTEYKLPILSLLLEAAELIKSNIPRLFLVGTPFLVVCIAAGLWMRPMFTGDPSSPEDFSFGMFFLAWLAMMTTMIMATVGCHRTFLLQGPDAPKTPIIRWGWREMRFIGKWILIGLCAMVLAMPFMFLIMPFLVKSGQELMENQYLFLIGTNLIYLPIYYVIARLMLVLPATAIDERWSLTDAWRNSSGNGWRVMLVVGIVPMIVNLIISLLPALDSILYFVFHVVLWLVVAVYGIALLSLSYKYLSENNQQLLTLSNEKLDAQVSDEDFYAGPNGPELRD